MLKEKLNEISIQIGLELPEELIARHRECLKKLQEIHIEEKTIKAGEELPDFTLVDTLGSKYSKESFVDKKMVFNFFRGSW